jgi:hypothetical protein
VRQQEPDKKCSSHIEGSYSLFLPYATPVSPGENLKSKEQRGHDMKLTKCKGLYPLLLCGMLSLVLTGCGEEKLKVLPTPTPVKLSAQQQQFIDAVKKMPPQQRAMYLEQNKSKWMNDPALQNEVRRLQSSPGGPTK